MIVYEMISFSPVFNFDCGQGASLFIYLLVASTKVA
jgi:hypothetical protein